MNPVAAPNDDAMVTKERNEDRTKTVEQPRRYYSLHFVVMFTSSRQEMRMLRCIR